MRYARILLAVVGAVVLAGCIRSETVLDLDTDGTADGSIVIAFDAELLSTFGVDPAEFAEQAITEGGGEIPGEVEEYDEDGFVGLEVTLDDAPLDEVAEGSQLVLTQRDDGSFEFRLPTETITQGLADAAGQDAPAGFSPEALLEDASVTYELTFPYEVVEHNADRLEGGTVFYDVDLTDPPAEYFAVTNTTTVGGGVPVWLWVVVGVVVLAGVVAVVLAPGGRDRKEKPPPPDPDTAVGADTDAPAGTDPSTPDDARPAPPPPGPTTPVPGDPAPPPPDDPTPPPSDDPTPPPSDDPTPPPSDEPTPPPSDESDR